jgi:hypothetical protein
VAAEVSGRQASRFYSVRQRIYGGLLIFVVAAGLPIVGVPALRHRLSDRAIALKTAFGNDIRPVTAKVGENREPFPAEYERPEPVALLPPQLPPLERVFTMKPGGGYVPQAASTPRPRARAREETPRVEIQPPAAASAEQTEPDKTASASAPSDEPKYQKGKIEQDAYDLLIKSNPTVAGMVQGSNPALHFKSWDAAGRGDDVYWVRLKFQSDGSPDVEYIWQVKIQSNQVTPLNYNARILN